MVSRKLAFNFLFGKHIRNSTPTRLYANGSPLSNRGSWIAGIILRFEEYIYILTRLSTNNNVYNEN